jgi:hypothetical protein
MFLILPSHTRRRIRISGSGRKLAKKKSFHSLKVDGNEKLGGLRFLQLLGIGLGPWRSMFIFILNMPFANAKRISVYFRFRSLQQNE